MDYQMKDHELVEVLILPPVLKKIPSRLREGFSWSERRGSNPRPRPWQGRALPTELLSQFLLPEPALPDPGMPLPAASCMI